MKRVEGAIPRARCLQARGTAESAQGVARELSDTAAEGFEERGGRAGAGEPAAGGRGVRAEHHGGVIRHSNSLKAPSVGPCQLSTFALLHVSRHLQRLRVSCCAGQVAGAARDTAASTAAGAGVGAANAAGTARGAAQVSSRPGCDCYASIAYTLRSRQLSLAGRTARQLPVMLLARLSLCAVRGGRRQGGRKVSG